MSDFWNWWKGLPEGYRDAVIAGLVASAGWLAVKGIPSIVARFRRRRRERILGPIVDFLRREHPFGKRADQIATEMQVRVEEAEKRLFELEDQNRVWRDVTLRWHPGKNTNGGSHN